MSQLSSLQRQEQQQERRMEEDGVGGKMMQNRQPVSAAIKGGTFEVTKFIARNISWIFIRWGQVR